MRAHPGAPVYFRDEYALVTDQDMMLLSIADVSPTANAPKTMQLIVMVQGQG
jgi:hypothetical protein